MVSGTTAIPADEITVQAGSTVSIGVAFDATYGVVGGMDTSSGTASAGTVETVSSPSDASNKFGADSELHDASKLAFRHPIETLYMIGVSETETTESFAASSSGTLGNTPVFDPNLHGEHTISATDTVASASVTVNVSYDSPPSAPTDANTIALNPHSGEWTADESSDYDITYTYGDYSAAITAIADEAPRVITVLSETESHGSSLVTELDSNETDFDFTHGFIGAPPRQDAETATNYASNYSDSIDDKRLSIVAPPRGTGATDVEEERTIAEIGARAASLPLGETMTQDSGALGGFESLRTSLATGDASTFIDSQVMPLLDNAPRVAKDQTTSTEVRFERVYSNQIADEGTARIHEVSADYVGGLNIAADRRQYRRSVKNELNDMQTQAPPLLDAFAVNVSESDTDVNDVVVDVGLDIVDVVDNVIVTISLGDVIQNET